MHSNLKLIPIMKMAKRLSPRLAAPLVMAIYSGKNRFSELAEVYPMSTRTLAKSLKNLEIEGIVLKSDDKKYSLTIKGNELAKVLTGVTAWANKYYG